MGDAAPCQHPSLHLPGLYRASPPHGDRTPPHPLPRFVPSVTCSPPYWGALGVAGANAPPKKPQGRRAALKNLTTKKALLQL